MLAMGCLVSALAVAGRAWLSPERSTSPVSASLRRLWMRWPRGAWFILISPVWGYCDVAGLRLMVRLTRADDLNGDHESTRRVVLHGVASHLTAVLGVLGWDRTRGLVLG
jgi:hypothetical protein